MQQSIHDGCIRPDRVLVTGGASGIGLAISRAFANSGATVAIADRDAEGLARAVQEFEGRGQRVHPYVCDVTHLDALEHVLQAASDRLDGLQAVVANAGLGLAKPFLETTTTDFERIYSVNVLSTFATFQLAAARMITRKVENGSLLAIASVTGLRACAERSAYGPAKAAVINLIQVIAVELAVHGIRANAICPGPVETPLIAKLHDRRVREQWLRNLPMRRYGSVDEIAELAVFLASPRASFITGQAICADGGWSTAGLMGNQLGSSAAALPPVPP